MFFKKNEETQKEIESMVVVFNIADHESVIAATMAVTLLRERTALDVDLVDVRDVISADVDKYVYVNCGTRETFLDYIDGAVRSGVPDMAKNAKRISDRAVFLNSIRRPRGEVRQYEDSVIWKTYNLLLELGLVFEEDGGIFYRYCGSSVIWATGINDEDAVVGYSDMLQACYRYYNGGDFLFEFFEKRITADSDAIGQYKQSQKEANRVIAKRVSLTNLNGKVVQHLTSTGPEVYGIIRRILLSKQDYLHVSEGRFGRVIFSSISVPKVLITERSVFNISPQGE